MDRRLIASNIIDILMTTTSRQQSLTAQMISPASTAAAAKQRTSQRHQHVLLFLMMLLTSTILPMHAFVAVPSLQQRYEPSIKVPRSTQLHEKKRTKGSGGGFGSVVKDMMSSSSAATKTFPFTGAIRPGNQSPQRVVVEEGIMKPDYWQTGVPLKTKKGLLPWMIEVKTSEEIIKMKEAGKLARRVLDMAGRAVRPGITTDEIDAMVHDETIKVRTAR